MTRFKVMTWNLENLFRPGSEAGPEHTAEFIAKVNSLAQVILTLDPDILGVQEVGDIAAFEQLVSELEGRYPHTALSGKPDNRGIRVGFLSKLVIEDQEDVLDYPGNLIDATRIGRGVLRIQVSPKPDFPIHLMVAHLKSKLLTFSGSDGRTRFSPRDEDERARVAGIALLRRTAEAVVLRVKANELLERNNRNRLILMGDLNDVTEAATTQILQGPSGSEIGTRGFDKPDKGDDTRLFNLAPLIPEARRFSRVFRGNGELIDHIFVSQELLPLEANGRRRVPIVDSHVDIFDGGLPSITENPNLRRGKPGSDHAPITATFEL